MLLRALGILLLAGTTGANSIQIRVDALAGRRPISPYLYGRNGNLSGLDKSMWTQDPRLALEAGLRLSRESDGNNGTKYNWKNDLSSHPDWYDNVYPQHWPERARAIQDNFPETDGLFGLQVLGWVAETDKANADVDKLDPQHKEPRRHLAGGGNPSKYLKKTTPQEVAGILDHWFAPKPQGLGLDEKRFHLWHMDNEPEGWSGTHSDVSPKPMTAEECVQKYAALARIVRKKHPEIQLMAPGFMSEWFWWNWSDHKCVDGLPWMEYFIKRMAEESKKFGKPLIDMIDIHTYVDKSGGDPGVLYQHRNWYDPLYQSPSANGCKRWPDCAGMDENQKVEMVFARIEGWLDKYFGPGHGLGIGSTESGQDSKRAMVRALCYASHLGTFADHGVRVYTPWYWRDEMWEVLHLFSRYAGTQRVQADSDGEPEVSAYASLSAQGDRMTVILVNRNETQSRSLAVSLAHFSAKGTRAKTLTLSNLPDDRRTFESRDKNALVKGEVKVGQKGIALKLAPWSITALLLEGREKSEKP